MDYKILKEKNPMYNTDILQVVAARFTLNLVQLFIISTNEKMNLHSLHYVLKHKIYTVFRTNTQTCSQTYHKIKLTLEKQNDKQTHIPVDISL